MAGSFDTPSAQLVEANRRLYQLRAQAQRLSAGASRQQVQNLPLETAVSAPVTALPDHLGWESTAVTAVLRRWPQAAVEEAEDPIKLVWQRPDTPQPDSNPQPCAGHAVRTQQAGAMGSATHSAAWIKLYPDIGLGMLRQEMTAPGRLWLMLHHLDGVGRGVLRIDIVAHTLTSPSSTLRLCGKRQLRNLLRAGDGLFWSRDGEYIWLRSAARVAAALAVTHLSGRPVALPLSALLEGIGAFRAHLYAAFHSGRRKETTPGSPALPIARETLAGLSGVGRSSQRAYEAQTGVDVQTNYAIGERLTEEKEEQRAWRQGTAVFQLRDYHGQQGKPGQCYLAWQLPNTYVGSHQQRPQGRQQRINRQLKDLVTKGTPGNVGHAGETQPTRRRYYPQGKQAVQAASRVPTQEVYWRERGNGRFARWQQAGGG